MTTTKTTTKKKTANSSQRRSPRIGAPRSEPWDFFVLKKMQWPAPFRRSITARQYRPAECPKCQATMTELAEGGPGRPHAFDFTMCWQCEETLRFDERLKLRTLSDTDRRALDAMPSVARELEQLKIQIAVARKKNLL
jgi:hypothetical protein